LRHIFFENFNISKNNIILGQDTTLYVRVLSNDMMSIHKCNILVLGMNILWNAFRLKEGLIGEKSFQFDKNPFEGE
jgi:hypothetical protein